MDLRILGAIDINEQDHSPELITLLQTIQTNVERIREAIRTATDELTTRNDLISQIVTDDHKGALKLRNLLYGILKPFFEAARQNDPGLYLSAEDIHDEFLFALIDQVMSFSPFINILFIDSTLDIDLEKEIVEIGWNEIVTKNPDKDLSNAVRIPWQEMIAPMVDSIFEVFSNKYSFFAEQLVNSMPLNVAPNALRKILSEYQKSFRIALEKTKIQYYEYATDTGIIQPVEVIIKNLFTQIKVEFDQIHPDAMTGIGIIIPSHPKLLLFLESWLQEIRQKFINKT